MEHSWLVHEEHPFQYCSKCRAIKSAFLYYEEPECVNEVVASLVKINKSLGKILKELND